MAPNRGREAAIANRLLGFAIAIALLDLAVSLRWNDAPWMRWAFAIWFAVLLASRLLPVSTRLQVGLGAVTVLLCVHGGQAVIGRRWTTQLQGVERAGRILDSRAPQEVVDDLRAHGYDATLPIMPANLFVTRGRWVNIAGAEVVSLGGISRMLTVHCNENGYYSQYLSDEHGFNNPQGLWKPGGVEIAFIGDSVTQGACVMSPDTIPGIVRKQYTATLNLGMAGNGPLIELATLREYAAPMRPRRVLWMFSDTDMDDLEVESRSLILRQYLQPGFNVRLIDHQGEIDAQLIQTRDEMEKMFRRWPAFLQEIGLSRARSPYWWQDIVMSGEVTPFTRFLRMSNLKPYLDMRIGPVFAPKVRRSIGPEIKLETILQLARDEVRGWGGELYFVYTPSYGDLKYRNRLSAGRTAGLLAAQTVRVPIIDLLPLFSDGPTPLDNFAFSYSHYNERGYQQASQGILAALRTDLHSSRARGN